MTLMHDMGLNYQQRVTAQNYFNQGKAANFNLAEILQRLLSTCGDNPELLKLFMDIQYRAAQTDGLTEKKLQVLDVIFRRMGFAPLHEQHRFYTDFGGQGRDYSSNQQSRNQHSYNRSRANESHKAQNTLTHAYAILELTPNANKQETKRAYRRLISRNHPDKLIAQGLPEEMIKVANDKTQKITKAYEQICSSKGW
jgi:DnaJ like chaperone protein